MKRKGFTLIELLVVIAIIALLLAILMPALKKAKIHAMTAVCLSNLKQLSLSWMMYADDNEGKIPSSDINYKTGANDNRPHWVKPNNTENDIRNGTLWPYVEDLKLYKCPTGKREEIRTYSMVNSMNSWDHGSLGRKGRMVKNMRRLRQPSSRLVFIDQGKIIGNAFAVWYNKPEWFNNDPPPVRHANGATISFADGHSEHWKWTDQRTIKLGKGEINTYNQPGNQDLMRFQRSHWGELGYTP